MIWIKFTQNAPRTETERLRNVGYPWRCIVADDLKPLLRARCLRYCSMTHRITGRVRQRSITTARASGGVIRRGVSSGLAKPASRLATVRSARLKRLPARYKRPSLSLASSQSNSDSSSARLSEAAPGLMSYARIMARRVIGHIKLPIRRCQAEVSKKSAGLTRRE